MLHYRVVEKKRPGDEFTEGKYYGCLVNPGKIDLNGLAKRISAACTVTRADTLGLAGRNHLCAPERHARASGRCRLFPIDLPRQGRGEKGGFPREPD